MAAYRLACLLAVSALLGTGCGLPDPFFLSPPSVTVAGTVDYRFQLTTTDRTAEPEFRGYELYYKIYSTDSAALAEQNVGGTDPGVSALTAKGFMAVTRGPPVPPATAPPADTYADTRTPPLISIAPGDRSSSFSIAINFNPALPPQQFEPTTNFSYTSPTTGAIKQEIDRHVNASPGPGCKRFTFGQGYYLQGDQDIASAGALGSTIFVAMYVVSYGLLDPSTPIYSYPVYMGYLQLSSYFP